MGAAGPTIGAVSGLVDLRSDTVTQPTPEMRKAMAAAEVGDDQYGEDPTVRELEAVFADRVGMEAALYVPSGTMANQLALRVLGRPGTTVIAGRRSHLVSYEHAASATNSAVQIQALDDPRGVLDPAAVEAAREGVEHHQPTPSLISVENTHMASGGCVLAQQEMKALLEAAATLPVHVDGARIFNAEVATGVPAAQLLEGASTMMACLSKGLCAPVGSLFAGSTVAVATARLERQRLGGAMRQAGIIAAAGLVALRSMVDRLAEDHDRAGRLAAAVRERWPEVEFETSNVETNIVVFAHRRPAALLDHLRAAGVLAGTIGPRTVRLVTHRNVDDTGVKRAIAALRHAPE